MKKFISVLLLVLILISVAPVYAFAGSSLSKHNVGDTIIFGSYPQSRVTDTNLIESLEKQPLQWVSYGYCYGNGKNITERSADYMQYADVAYNGEKYRAVRISKPRPYRPELQPWPGYSYQDDNGYGLNKIYWFKFEDIKWIVLDPNTGLVLAEDIIDSQPSFIFEGKYAEGIFSSPVSRVVKEKPV